MDGPRVRVPDFLKIDPLRFVVISRRPMIHEYEKVFPFMPELSFNDVTRLLRIDEMKPGIGQAEKVRVVDQCAVDAAVARRILMHDFVLPAQRRKVFDEHLDDLAILDLAQSKHIRPAPIIHLLDDGCQIIELPLEPLGRPTFGRRGREFLVHLDVWIVFEIEQVLDVPGSDVEFRAERQRRQ